MKILLLLFLPLFAFPQCPVITQQPQSQIDCEGNSIRMIVGSNGTTLQWEKKRPQDASFTNITGATQVNYQITPTGNTTNPNGTLYRAKISTGNCSVYSEPARIELRKINSILNNGICERGDGVLESVQTDGATKFQWMRSVNNGPFDDIMDNEQMQGSQHNQLQIKNAQKNLNGQKFKVRIDFAISPNNDNGGSSQNLNQTSTCPRTSSEITLQIKSPPTPKHAFPIYSGCIGEAFSVNATGCSPYITKWYDQERNPIGTGSRLLFTRNNEIPQLVFATCVQVTCESLLSTGTQTQAFQKPHAPQNSGTPEEICPGLLITFKASGGSNNLWYLSSSSINPLSTATTYSTLAGSTNSRLSRFVTQKINGCESDRTEIAVQIRQNATCNSEDNASNPPPTINPPPMDTSTRTLPRVQLSYQLHQNCESAKYTLKVEGCPVTTHIKINGDVMHISNYFESFAAENAELLITCPESISTPINLILPRLEAPDIAIKTNYQNFTCEGDKTNLSVQLPHGTSLVGWEYNGHLFSQQNNLNESLAAGQYQAIVQKNGCLYRSEFVAIDVRPKPQPPKFLTLAANICVGDTITFQAIHHHNHYLWNETESQSKYMVIGKLAGKIQVQARISDDGACWSINSEIILIQVNPIPEKPQILLQKNGGFCEGDSTQLGIDKTGIRYRWSTNETSQRIYSNKPELYEAFWQDSTGCWSPPSTRKQTFYFPAEPRPEIHVVNRQFCYGETITLRGSPAFEYHWNTQDKLDSIVINTHAKIYLKTRNEYGCWSPQSQTLELVAQENPWMPKIIRSGAYFIQASNQERVTKYEWVVDKKAIPDSSAQIKLKQSGLFQVRAVRKYELIDAKPIRCYSPFQVASFGIPVDDPGVRLYPNPNKGEYMQVEIQEDISNIQASLYNLAGKVIKQWEMKNTSTVHSLNLFDIPSGTYIVALASNHWSHTNRIFIVSD